MGKRKRLRRRVRRLESNQLSLSGALTEVRIAIHELRAELKRAGHDRLDAIESIANAALVNSQRARKAVLAATGEKE